MCLEGLDTIFVIACLYTGVPHVGYTPKNILPQTSNDGWSTSPMRHSDDEVAKIWVRRRTAKLAMHPDLEFASVLHELYSGITFITMQLRCNWMYCDSLYVYIIALLSEYYMAWLVDIAIWRSSLSTRYMCNILVWLGDFPYICESLVVLTCIPSACIDLSTSSY